MSAPTELKGPDLAAGIPEGDLADGAMMEGHAHGESVLLARQGDEVFAVGAYCTHYGAPLADGLLVDDTVRCPFHHACFSLRTGHAVRAPALNPVTRFDVEQGGGRLRVLGKSTESDTVPGLAPPHPRSIVILGGGAAGQAAAEAMLHEGYRGKLTMLSADVSPPCDRPNLSKDYLAGTAPEEWMPLRPKEYYGEQGIELVLAARATRVDLAKKEVLTEGGKAYPYDLLLLATGAEPVKLSVPGADLPHVHTLRTLGDSRAIIAALGAAKRAVVIGASFIGLEVAASLRTRGLEVHVVAPEARPLERVLGPVLGDFIRGLHEEHGVVFHLGETVKEIGASGVTLASGKVVAGDLVVAGVGVRPAVALAEQAGLATDRGVLVDEHLATSAPGVYAAGDIARWPDPRSGEKIRVEHWVVAERQGQIAARNMLGKKEPCDLVPFFWSQHYDVGISYVGHAETWDAVEVDGSLAAHDATVTFKRGGRALAVATIGRDLANLRAEARMEGERKLA